MLNRLKLNIRTKLLGSFLIVVAIVAIVGVIGYINLKKVNQSTDIIYTQGVTRNQQLDKIDETIFQLRGDYYKYMIVPAERDSWKTSIASEEKTVNDILVSYQAYLEQFSTQSHDAAAVKSMNNSFVALNSAWATYVDCTARVLKAVDNAQPDEAVKLILVGGDLSNSRRAASAAIATMEQVQNKQVELARTNSNHILTYSTLIIVGLSILAALIAIIVCIVLTRNITRPINKVKQALAKMAVGDLTEKVKIMSNDEIGEMVKSYNATQKYLGNLISQLKMNSSQLSSAGEQLSIAAQQTNQATQQVATSSQEMAKGAQEQSTSAQETAQSIEQLSGTINQLSDSAKEQFNGIKKAVTSITSVSATMSEVAQNAHQAAQGAKQAAESANTGAQKAKLTLSGMDNIKKSAADTAKKIEELGTRSVEIGKIVAVIDDIAAQTNLLALNAAIEAARAGDQGRGFAVVSDEVRKLAERTATATKEIAELIGSVQKGVDEANHVMALGSAAVTDGYNLANQAGQALDQILKASSDVNIQVEQISTRVQQVNTATGELVKIIDSVGGITEQNAAATEMMSSNAAQVTKAIETVAGIAEENSAATEQVSASSEEMSAQAEEIVASSHTMKEMARSMEANIAMFKINDESANPPK
jgi:methyl-accepting chemotaxis protein